MSKRVNSNTSSFQFSLTPSAKSVVFVFLFFTIIISSVFTMSSIDKANATTHIGWHQANIGGQVSLSDGVFTLSGDERAAGPNLYKEFRPQNDFEISFQLKAETLGEINRDPNRAGEGFGFGFATNYSEPSQGAAFEMRARSGGQFLLVWHDDLCDLYGWSCNWMPFVYNGLAYNDGSAYWHSDPTADKSKAVVKPDVWYTIKLKVTAHPFTITSEVYTDDGVLLGSLTIDSINDFTFEDIRYVTMSSGFGGTFYVKNITGISPNSDFVYSPVTPTAYNPISFEALIDPSINKGVCYSWDFGDGNITTVAQPTITHTYDRTGTFAVTLTVADFNGDSSSTTKSVQVKLPAYLTISTESYSLVGSTINIYGRLHDISGNGLGNEWVILYYTFTGINKTYPIGSACTNENGEYDLQWINSVTGTFSLIAKWAGNQNYCEASNITSFSSIIHESEAPFLVESNSTISGLEFNSSSGELSFAVSGPTGSSGYTKIMIAKSILNDTGNIKVQLDGRAFNYSTASTSNSWILTFHYTHSMHTIKVFVPETVGLENSNISPTSNEARKEAGILLWSIVAGVIIVAITAGIALVKLKNSKHT